MTARAAEADPATLEQQAREADRLADQTENRALSDGDLTVSLSQVQEHRNRADGLRWRARAASAKLAREAENRRKAALTALHAEITERAQLVAAGALDSALDEVRQAAAKFVSLVAEHDALVVRFRQRAADLGASGTTPSGPAGENEHVGSGGNCVLASDALLRVVGADTAAHLVAEAGAGRAVRIEAASVVAPARPAPKFLLLGRSGALVTADYLTPAQHHDMAAGDLVALGPGSIDLWLRGRLVIDPNEVDDLRKRQMKAAKLQQQVAVAATAKAQEQAQRSMAGV